MEVHCVDYTLRNERTLMGILHRIPAENKCTWHSILMAENLLDCEASTSSNLGGTVGPCLKNSREIIHGEQKRATDFEEKSSRDGELPENCIENEDNVVTIDNDGKVSICEAYNVDIEMQEETESEEGNFLPGREATNVQVTLLEGIISQTGIIHCETHHQTTGDCPNTREELENFDNMDVEISADDVSDDDKDSFDISESGVECTGSESTKDENMSYSKEEEEEENVTNKNLMLEGQNLVLVEMLKDLNDENEPPYILQLPEMILEDIFKKLSLNEVSNNVRPICRMFHNVATRILRLAFKSVVPRLEVAMKEVNEVSINKWSRVCTGILTYKLLESELLTLRAACARQVESGLWCFIPGKTLEEYIRIIMAIQNGKISGILEGISDTLIRLNKLSFDYFDEKYEETFTFSDMKLLGVEIVEILNIAMNTTASMTVTYDSGNEDGSCFLIGRFTIPHCTELKSPPVRRNTLNVHRKALLMYLRYLVRANNCDIVLRKLREWNAIVKMRGDIPNPFLESMKWDMQYRYNVHEDYMHEVYKKDAVEEISDVNWPEKHPDCNMRMECSFQLLCPKSMNPLGIQFFKKTQEEQDGVKPDSTEYESMQCEHCGQNNQKHNKTCCNMSRKILQHLFSFWEEDSTLSLLRGEEYNFSMSLRMWHLNKETEENEPKEEIINVRETCITNRSDGHECFLEITGDTLFNNKEKPDI